jgi:hypothetical protein
MFPENTRVTMTTREVTTFLGELGEVRLALGRALERLDRLRPDLDKLGKLFDERGDRITAIERSLAACQEACGIERVQRHKVLHWVAYVVAGIIPGAVIWYFTRHFAP